MNDKLFHFILGLVVHVQSAKIHPELSAEYPYPFGLTSSLTVDYKRQNNNGVAPNPYKRSQAALQLPLISDSDELTVKLRSEIKEGLQYVFQTRNDWTFPIHGTGVTGMQAVLDNLIESGDCVVVGVCGLWGEMMANISERLDAYVVRIRKPIGTRFSLEEITNAVNKYKPKILALVQGESTAGVYQPLDGIGDLCHRKGCFLVSDATSIVGMQPVLMDKLKIDATFGNSNKGIGGISGLAPISHVPPRGYPTDLAQQYRIWHEAIMLQSNSVPLMYSIREALAFIAEEGIQNTFDRHRNSTLLLYRDLESLGLEYFVEEPADRMVGITTIKIPRGKDALKVASYMLKRYNILISTGYGDLDKKVLRFAFFSTNAFPAKVENLILALKNALASPETNI